MTSPVRRPLFLLTLIAITAIGLALRIANATGGLWVDEAWSAVLADKARTPMGIFVAINHDNNHHLNSLWMQAMGFGAAPLALRGLSIATGTATILIAAAIGWRRSAVQGLVLALLFAVSPILVNYGSEARGYAPMSLAALTAIFIVTRALDRPTLSSRTGWALGALTAIGLLAQLTMVFFVAAILVWVGATLIRRLGTDAGLSATFRLMMPSIAAAILIFALVFGAAGLSVTGMQVGDYVPFSASALISAFGLMIATSVGIGWAPAWASAMVLLAALAGIAARRPTAPFHAAAILGLPLTLALLQIGNTSFPRYFLLSSIALLLLAGELVPFARTRPTRALGLVLLTMVTLGCLHDDLAQIAVKRGDSGAAVATMAARAPGGATILVEHLRPVATLRVSAATARYPLRIVGDCRRARFAYLDLDRDEAAPQVITRCEFQYRRAIVRRGGLLSGVDWALYDGETNEVSVN